MSLEQFAKFASAASSLGGAVGGIGSLIGGIGGAFNAAKNRRQAERMQKQMMDWQSKENRLAFERNLNMWHNQNVYNSPAEQMKRLQEAGLNPNLAYSSLSAGAAGAPPEYIPANVPAPSEAMYSNPYDSVINASASLANNSLATAQIAHTRANTKNVELQNFRLSLENTELLPAEIADRLNEFAYNRDVRPQALALGALNLKRADQEVKNMQKQFDILEQNLQGLKYENKIKSIEASIAELTKTKRLESICAQYDMTIEEGKRYAEMLGYQLATANYNAQIAFAKMLDESSDNELKELEREENKSKAKVGKEKLKGRKLLEGDDGTTLGKITKTVQRFAGFSAAVTEGIVQFFKPITEFIPNKK